MDRTPDQQPAPQAPPPPQPRFQAGIHSLTAEQVAACVDPHCKRCHGTGIVQAKKGSRRTTCLCLQREMARRYGDAEDRRRVGVSTAEELALRQVEKQSTWKSDKAHHLGSRIETLAAREQAILSGIAQQTEALKAKQVALRAAIDGFHCDLQALAEADQDTAKTVEALRQRLRLLEAQLADGVATRLELSEAIAGYARDLSALEEQEREVSRPHEGELVRVRRELEKLRRRLGTHVAYHGTGGAS